MQPHAISIIVNPPTPSDTGSLVFQKHTPPPPPESRLNGRQYYPPWTASPRLTTFTFSVDLQHQQQTTVANPVVTNIVPPHTHTKPKKEQ